MKLLILSLHDDADGPTLTSAAAKKVAVGLMSEG